MMASLPPVAKPAGPNRSSPSTRQSMSTVPAPTLVEATLVSVICWANKKAAAKG
jgi:hypothetical protein